MNIDGKRFVAYNKQTPIAIDTIMKFKREGSTIKFYTNTSIEEWKMATHVEAEYVYDWLFAKLVSKIDLLIQDNANRAARKLNIDAETEGAQ